MAGIWVIVCIITLAFYLLLVIFCRYGWSRSSRATEQKFSPPISLVIPFRDEAVNLPVLASHLSRLDYPADLLEILFVDDHSTDNSVHILQKYIESIPFRCQIIGLRQEDQGKRAALRAGVESANFGHVLTTDADCEPAPGWVRSMATALTGTYRLICGPVKITPGRNLFHCLQELELMPVMAVTAGFAGIGQPVMASGANMLFLKNDFLRYLGEGFYTGSSGDDNWFLLYMKKEYPGSIRFHASSESIVLTAPPPGWKEFIQQRRRWTSKSKHFRDPALILLGLIITLINLLLPVTVILGFFFPELLLAALLLLASKTLLDTILLLPVLSFFHTLRLIFLIPLLELVYPAYSAVLLFFLLGGKYLWKGRSLS